MTTLESLIFTAGILHFGVLIASALVPQVLDWRGALAPLPALFRQIVWVHGAYVVLMIVGFGILSVLLPQELAGRTVLARGVCGFVAVFWGARLVLQFVLFRPGELLRNGVLRAGYHGLTAVFAYFVCVYAAAAVSYHAVG